MARVTNAVAAHKARKRLLKSAKGFVGDRKNHIRLSAEMLYCLQWLSTTCTVSRRRETSVNFGSCALA